MPINTPALLEKFLESRGYTPRISGESVLLPIGGTDAPYTAAFTFKNGELQITCQLALLGEFPEDRVPHLCLAALDANMQISPFAFAVIGSSEGEVDLERCPLVLTDTMLTCDLNEDEVAFAVDKLLEALTFSHDILKLGFTPTEAAR